MDIKTPNLNGYEAVKKIRKIKPGIIIIAQTAYALEQEIKKYNELFDDYITKPIMTSDLNEKLMKDFI